MSTKNASATAPVQPIVMLPCPFCGNGFPKHDTFQMSIGGGDSRKIYRISCIAKACKIQPLISVSGESGYRSGDKRTNEEAYQQVHEAWNQRST